MSRFLIIKYDNFLFSNLYQHNNNEIIVCIIKAWALTVIIFYQSV